VVLERGLRGIPKKEILDLRDPKLQRYNQFKIMILKERKK